MVQPDNLIARFQQKDASAFEKIYEMYFEALYGVINSVLYNEEVSREVLQDSFLKIWNNSDRYNPKKGRFFTWMLSIARNGAIDKLRSKDFKNQKKNQSAAYFVDIIEEKQTFLTSVDAIGIEKYIKVLEPKCKKIIHFLFFKGYTQKETAEELKIPLGTIKTRNRNCINKLRETIGVS